MASSEGSIHGWPVLVTGAAGFVGGGVARALIEAGCRVRGLTRSDSPIDAPPGIEWIRGDLRNADDLALAVAGMRGVIHSAGWVSLAVDHSGDSRRINVDATARLLDAAQAAGVERFVYTSTLWTVAAGTPEAPADEASTWNLEAVDSAYCATKREAERLVLRRNGPGFRTTAICPGFVVGPGDRRPTSTGLLLTMARLPFAIIAGGGIPFVDVAVLGQAHARALAVGTPGQRYAVVGPYRSYPEIAHIIRRLTGWPRLIVSMPDWSETLLRRSTDAFGRLFGDRLGEVSGAAITGGFLRLHVSGARADHDFGLVHPSVEHSIYEALADHLKSGRAPWLRGRLQDHAPQLNRPAPATLGVRVEAAGRR